MEIWKDIKGYEGFYQVSTYGRVKSLDRLIILKDRAGNPRPAKYKSKILKENLEIKNKSNMLPRKYVVLSKLCKKRRSYIHRLVANTFIKNLKKLPEVNHKDGNPLNNNIGNLEWVTKKYNIDHAFKNKLIKTQKPVYKLDKDTLKILEQYPSAAEASRQMGFSAAKVSQAINRKGTCGGYRWKYINSNV